MTKKSIIAIAVVCLLALSIIAATVASVAYLTSRRKAQGYINFAKGIEIEYLNVADSGSATQFGNLYYLNEDSGENENLQLNNILPGETIKLANPTLKAQDGTVSFALRAKLVVTATNTTGNYVFDNNAEYEFLTATTSEDDSQVVFSTGVIAFNDSWQYNADDGYYYYATSGAGSLADRIVEVDENSADITVFNADANSDYLTLTTLGEPIESFNYSSISFELYLQAIQYSSLDVWELD